MTLYDVLTRLNQGTVFRLLMRERERPREERGREGERLEEGGEGEGVEATPRLG
jgi:hypothetical protein